MAGLLGQLQVIMPWHWPIINTVHRWKLNQREADDLCGHRGLAAGSDHQTFAMSLPHKLRAYYDKVDFYWFFVIFIIVDFFSLFSCKVTCINYICTFNTQVVTPAAGTRGSQSRPRLTGTVLENVVAAYSTMNRYRLLKDLLIYCQGYEWSISSRFLTRFLEHALRDLDFEVNINLLTYFIIFIWIDIESLWTLSELCLLNCFYP